MRIIDSNSLGNCASTATNRAAETQTANSSSKKSGAAQRGAADCDTVELSGSMNAVTAAGSEYATSRAERIRELTAAVRSGTYEPDVQAMSSRMVDEALGELQ
jgi:flagellar biosynthesis anti-sigma factor FlgM